MDSTKSNAACFSLFAPGINTQKGQVPYVREATMQTVREWMASPRMKRLTLELRSIDNEKLQRAFKTERLPFATFGGVFSRRTESGLISPSGLQCFDFDHLGGPDAVTEVKTLLRADRYFDTQLMFTSPRGDGVKWVTSIDLSRATYAQWYTAICNYLHSELHLNPDSAPRNIASACFLCWDDSCGETNF